MITFKIVLVGLLLQVDDVLMANPALGFQPDANHTESGQVVELYDFDRAHPHNVSVEETSYKYINVSWMAPQQNASDVLYFVVNYERKKLVGAGGPTCPYGNMRTLNVTATPNTTSFHGTIKGLEAGTIYILCVEAVYVSRHRPYSHTLEHQTLGCGAFTAERRCACSTYGTDPEERCKDSSCECNCKSKFFTGDTCESCQPGYYLHKNLDGGRCEPCVCPQDRSNGTCSIVNSLVRCHCKSKYTGLHCQLCADGLTKTASGAACMPCQCNTNEHPADLVKCDRRSGVCSSCHYNTTGDHCERCKEGFQGDAVDGKCIMINKSDDVTICIDDSDSSSGRRPHLQRLHYATVVGVCVGATGLLIMLVSVCFVVRWKKLRRRPFSLWTVQLMADDERVKFSQMVDEDDGGSGDGRQLFEKDHQPMGVGAGAAGGHSSSKSNIYRAVRS